MKMVKSLLLGSAAGLVAVAGAQAADLPVKAKAVEYVKVCSLYGAGFFYIPGTDTCIKIGGYMRTEWNHNSAGSFSTYLGGENAFYERTGHTLINRSRGIMTFDVRSQTEYGTLRSYLRAGWQWTTRTDTRGGSATAVYLDRAFIQLAGFTFGKTQSFFDTPSIIGMTFQTSLYEDTGGRGTPVFAYTAALGNGVTATLSLEDHSERVAAVVDVTDGGVFPIGAGNPSSTAGNHVVDIVGNLRVDQAWGSAQISGALHQVRASYYNALSGLAPSAHPDDKWGYAVGAGLLLKMPWDPKDTFAIAASYGKGAVDYVINVGAAFLPSGNMWNVINPGEIGLGWADDAYFNSPGASGLELSEAWQINAGFEHYWTPTLRQSIHGTYVNYEASSSSVDTFVCPAVAVGAGVAGPGCADWSSWNIGSRLLWNPVANLDVGLEVLYSKMDQSAFEGAVVAATAVNPSLTVADTHVWSGIFRIQRNFWP